MAVLSVEAGGCTAAALARKCKNSQTYFAAAGCLRALVVPCYFRSPTSGTRGTNYS